MYVINHKLESHIAFRPIAYLFIKIYFKGLWNIRERERDAYNNNVTSKILIGILVVTIVAGAISIVSLIV
jgi:hypothetical protein